MFSGLRLGQPLRGENPHGVLRRMATILLPKSGGYSKSGRSPNEEFVCGWRTTQSLISGVVGELSFVSDLGLHGSKTRSPSSSVKCFVTPVLLIT